MMYHDDSSLVFNYVYEQLLIAKDTGYLWKKTDITN